MRQMTKREMNVTCKFHRPKWSNYRLPKNVMNSK